MKFLPSITAVSVSALFFITNAYAANMNPEQQKINAKIGSQFSIELKSNPTTGYLWILRKLPENVAYIGSQYKENISCKNKKLVGCGGNTTMHFIAVSPGMSKVVLQYAQPWEPLPKESTTYDINIK